jgi:hypothetical protein
MKKFIDTLKECPIQLLESKIKRQEDVLEICKRDLETMKLVLSNRTTNGKINQPKGREQ